MGKYSLEEYLQRRLQKHEEEISSPELFASLGIDEKKPTRAYLWTLPVFILLVGALVFYAFYYNQKVNSSANQVISQIEEPLPINNKIKEEAKIKSQNENITKELSTSQSKKENQALEQEVTDSKESRIPSTQKANIRQTKKTTQVSIPENNFNTKELSPVPVSHTKRIYEKQLEQSDMSEGLDPVLQDKKINTKADTTKSTDKKNSIAQIFNELTGLPFLQLALLPLPKRNKKAGDPDGVDRKMTTPRWHAYGSYAFLNRTLKSNHKNFDSYVNRRNATEKALDASGFGLAYSYPIYKGWYAKLGLEFQSLNERLNVSFTNDSLHYETDVATSIFVSMEGDTSINSVGEAYVNTEFTETWEIHNNHYMVNIPLSLGYRYAINNWELYGELSPTVSVYHQHNGTILNEVDQLQKNPEIFDLGLKWGYKAGLGLSYAFHPKLRLEGSFNYQNFNPSFTKTELMTQNYSLWGANLGLSYTL